jgi:hypothetical protein
VRARQASDIVLNDSFYELVKAWENSVLDVRKIAREQRYSTRATKYRVAVAAHRASNIKIRVVALFMSVFGLFIALLGMLTISTFANYAIFMIVLGIVMQIAIVVQIWIRRVRRPTLPFMPGRSESSEMLLELNPIERYRGVCSTSRGNFSYVFLIPPSGFWELILCGYDVDSFGTRVERHLSETYGLVPMGYAVRGPQHIGGLHLGISRVYPPTNCRKCKHDLGNDPNSPRYDRCPKCGLDHPYHDEFK